MLESSKSSLQSEINLLQQKNSQYSGSVDKQLTTIERLTQDVLRAKADLSKSEVRNIINSPPSPVPPPSPVSPSTLQYTVKSLKDEQSVLIKAEQRAREQYEGLLKDQHQQNLLLTNLQAIQNNMERSEFEVKTKLGTQIESLERELLLAKRKAEMEEERCQKITESFRSKHTHV